MDSRVVVVTGGFGALGRAVSAHFAAHGDRVARVDFAADAPADESAAIDLPGVDLTDDVAAKRAVEAVLAGFGRLDVLVNVAGGFVWETLPEKGLESWQRMHAMNVVTNVTMTQAALPALRKSACAHIVNIGAAAALKADAGMGSYAASKAAVHRLTESLAGELAGEGITVNAVLPTIIDTPANRRDMPDADFGQWVTAEAIADVIGFLASPSARAINGALIPVNRGG